MKYRMSALLAHLGHHWVNEWSFNEGVPSSLMRVVDVLHLSRKDLSFQVLFCWMINKQMQFVLVGSKNRVSAFPCSFRSSLTSEVTTRVRSRRYCASLTLSIQVERISLSRLFFSVGSSGRGGALYPYSHQWHEFCLAQCTGLNVTVAYLLHSG